MSDIDILTGSTERHLTDLHSGQAEGAMLVHQDIVVPLTELQQNAAASGFDLRLCSGFRSFDRQLHIWNAKLSGLRPVVDDRGALINLDLLSPWQQIQAVMRWSALPGASRHHWGTDIDIYDRAAMPADYQLQLIPAEVEGQGMFAPLHDWLDEKLADQGFYRPYGTDTGGVAPERWHISYRPLAQTFAQGLTAEVLEQRLQGTELLLLDVVLDHLDEILQRYIQVD